MRLLYSALWWVGLPVVLLRLWWRGRKEPGYRRHIPERLGFYQQFAHGELPSIIWVHAVSVGETRAAQPLVEALLQTYPHHTIVLTHMTATGRATGAELFSVHGARVVQCFFPYDLSGICKRFLRYFKPRICILMETEVWPNMVRQCGRHQVPILLANARLSERSLRRGQRFGAMLLEAAAGIDYVAAQSEADAVRMRLFGARHVEVTGSIKFDVAPPAEMIARGEQWRTRFAGRPVLLCASTREGEEELILKALLNCNDENVLIVMVPRHPQRFDEVEAMIKAHGFAMERRSRMGQGRLAPETQIFLGDSMGEMFAYYAACDIAFIGGSLLPLGGQNLIEACTLGKPVLIGPYTFNFQQISEDAVISGCAARVADADELLICSLSLLQDDAQRHSMGAKARIFSQQFRGATQKTMGLIHHLLDC